MTTISDLLSLDRVACNVPAVSKKRLLEQVSGMIAAGDPVLTGHEVFESLIARERLGSTGFGGGVAIPHGRLAGTAKTLGAFVKLDRSIDFDAIDSEPVDLLFVLLVPEQSTDEHLQLLSKVAEMFSDSSQVERLRQAQSAEDLYALIDSWSVHHGHA